MLPLFLFLFLFLLLLLLWEMVCEFSEQWVIKVLQQQQQHDLAANWGAKVR